MRNLGPVEAANEIRNDVFNMPGVDPEEQHQVRFIQSVCQQLGLEPTPDNMHKVSVVLHKHDIGLHVGHEFPKYAVRNYDKAQKIVHDEQQEKEWVEQAPPEPREPLGPVVEEPVQGEGVDLSTRMPHPAEPKPAPDVVTVATAPQEAGHSEVLAEEDHDEAEIHDEEVHVEDASSRRPPVGTRRPK